MLILPEEGWDGAGGLRLRALSKGSARRTVGGAGPLSRTHTLSSCEQCVCGGGDKRESKAGHGCVYLKLLFPLQVPVP